MVLRVAGAEGVVVLVLALQVVFTVLAQGGGGHTVGGEVHRQVLVTLALPGVEGTPATQLAGLAPPLVSEQISGQSNSLFHNLHLARCGFS